MTHADDASRAPFRVLVLCTGNSARSQLAEALIASAGRSRAAGRVDAQSAGARPAARVHPLAVETLAARGIAWRDRTPRHVNDVAGARFDLVITVCDHARDVCPVLPGAGATVHWGLPDPADEADPESARRAFSATYDALQRRVEALLALPLETMSARDVADRARAIHASVGGGT